MLSETAIKIVVTAIVGLVLLCVFKRWLETLVIAVSLILEAMVFLTISVIVGGRVPTSPASTARRCRHELPVGPRGCGRVLQRDGRGGVLAHAQTLDPLRWPSS